jgi:hypothetical protein
MRQCGACIGSITPHGVDIDANGDANVTTQRVHQLISRSGDIRDHTFSIEFLDPRVQVNAFTFR